VREIIDKLQHVSQAAVTHLRVRSALNPMLWLSVMMALLCFVTAYLFRDDPFLRTLLAVGGLVPAAFTCVHATYFVFWKPEKLQSEDYQIRQQALALVFQKGVIPKGQLPPLDSILNPPAAAQPGNTKQPDTPSTEAPEHSSTNPSDERA
jgi:hypothetical protein